ncbi:MAG TPA: DotU family type IV/VI secretion system protein [Candidatus Binatia bacterium]|nr:DotU family type IV/VI secretion system protein [Candidatus Binatia bacterium]
MTLLELTEPIFQYVCRLNRLARKSAGTSTGETAFLAKSPSAAAMPRLASLDYAVVRSEVKALFEDCLQKSNSDIRLSMQAKKVELPLLFFVDSMISESSLPFATQWNQNRLAYERNELAGDEKFFDLLEETMKESGEEASERLAVFYNCVGLGFSGIYFRQPEYLRKTMLTLAPRIRHLVEADQTAKICPDAYEAIDTRNLVQPPSSKMVFVGLLFLCFILAALITYGFLYRAASKSLSSSLDHILSQEVVVKK